jgi:prevent-host-death family protein
MMTTTADIHEAKTTLSRLVERALAGEDVIIARDGKPAVRLVPVTPDAALRRPGRPKGRVRVASDFDQTPDSAIDAFECGR